MSSGHFSRRSYQVDLLALQYHLRRWGMLLAVIQVVLRTFDLFLKVIPEGVVEGRKLEATTKTWKLDRLGRALTALSTQTCPPRHQRHYRCRNPPSLPLVTSLLYPYIRELAVIMDTSHISYWQRLLYWTAFWNTLFYLLTREPRTVRLQHGITLAMGCYTHAYALMDEARKQQYVSFASMIISAVAIGHMAWMYRQRRDAR